MDGSQASNLKHNVTYDDLRDYIEEVDKLGELRRVQGATWEEDIGMAAELLLHSETAPCALFDEIPGYPKGHRVFTRLTLFVHNHRRLFVQHGVCWNSVRGQQRRGRRSDVR